MKEQFEVHMLNEQGKNGAMAIACNFHSLLCTLEALCPDGREMAIVRTKLEEACFFAKKAMAKVKENQQA